MFIVRQLFKRRKNFMIFGILIIYIIIKNDFRLIILYLLLLNNIILVITLIKSIKRILKKILIDLFVMSRPG